MNAMTGPLMNCDDFAAQLADYLDGDASDAARAAVETHAAQCDSCGALLADLRALSHQASALPVLAPSRDLWTGIAERIDARVLPLDATRGSRALPARRGWLRPAAAAAALVIATAGITHEVTRRSLETSIVVAPPPPASAPQRVAMTGPAIAPPAAQPSTSPANPDAAAPSRPAPRSMSSARGGERVAPVRLASTRPLLGDAEPVYDREIATLRVIVRQRRTQLDPATMAVLEQSIAVIDSAIAQSRAALAKDPASGFLSTQLNHSLEKKVELLRTAALLPSRT